MEIMDVMWFTGGSCVGIVQVKDEYDGIKYYIGCPPGEAKGFNEAEDIGWIADWGSTFPKSVGDVLFGGDPLRDGSAVQIPMSKEQAQTMVAVGMSWKAPKHIPEGYEWIIVPDPKTIFRGYLRKIFSERP